MRVNWICRIGTGESEVEICEATRERRWESGEIMGAQKRVAPKWLRIHHG